MLVKQAVNYFFGGGDRRFRQTGFSACRFQAECSLVGVVLREHRISGLRRRNGTCETQHGGATGQGVLDLAARSTGDGGGSQVLGRGGEGSWMGQDIVVPASGGQVERSNDGRSERA